MKSFESELIARVHLIRAPWHLDREGCDEFAGAIAGWAKQDVLLHVVDFGQTRVIPSQLYQFMAHFKSALQGSTARLVSINLNPQVTQQLQKDGVLQTFSPQTSMKQAISELGQSSRPANIKLDDELLKPLQEGLRHALSAMNPDPNGFQTRQLLPPLSIKDPDQLAVTLGATTHISGEHATGEVGVYFTREALKNLFEKVAHQKFESEQTARAQDLVRELLNMATGRAKADWHANRGLTVDRTIPKTVVGDPLQEHLHGFVAEAAILPIDTMQGQVFLGVKLNGTKPQALT